MSNLFQSNQTSLQLHLPPSLSPLSPFRIDPRTNPHGTHPAILCTRKSTNIPFHPSYVRVLHVPLLPSRKKIRPSFPCLTMHYAPFEMWAASVSWRTWKEQQGGMGNMHVMQTGGRQKRKVRYAQQKKEVEWNGKCNPSAGRKKERERDGNMPRLQMQQRGREGGRCHR